LSKLNFSADGRSLVPEGLTIACASATCSGENSSASASSSAPASSKAVVDCNAPLLICSLNLATRDGSSNLGSRTRRSSSCRGAGSSSSSRISDDRSNVGLSTLLSRSPVASRASVILLDKYLVLRIEPQNIELERKKEGDIVGQKAAKIEEQNVDFKLLQRMGYAVCDSIEEFWSSHIACLSWKEGECIGVTGGLTAPLTMVIKNTKLGLGAGTVRWST
jgi:hypothetical protein